MKTAKDFLTETANKDDILLKRVISHSKESKLVNGEPLYVTQYVSDDKVWCSRGINSAIKMPYNTADLEMIQ